MMDHRKADEADLVEPGTSERFDLLDAEPVPDPADFDPMQEPVWTIVMVMAWIASRDVDRVRWQMDDWRRAHGLPPSSSALAGIIHEAEDDDDVTGFAAIPARDSLLRECKAGTIVGSGLSSREDVRIEMPRMKWWHGGLNWDREFRERWDADGETFANILFDRQSVLKVWPAQDHHSTTVVPDAAADALSSMQSAIAAAIARNWPCGLPPFTSKKARNAAIFDAMKAFDPKAKKPDDVTFRRYFNRATNSAK